MRDDKFPPDVLRFLQTFFGLGNKLQWGKFPAKAVPFLNPWLEDLKNCLRPVMLPRVNINDQVEWYALAFSKEQKQTLREDLLAFVGPTYTNFIGQPGILDPDDPVDAAVFGLVGNHVYRLLVLDLSGKEKVRESLGLMRTLWEQKPTRTVKLARPTGRILRDFEMALRVGKFQMADDYLAELKGSGHLSAHNLAFLKVRRLAAAAAWSEIMDLPEVNALLAMRRPALVTQSLVQAVYQQKLAEFETRGDPNLAVAYFRDQILPTYGPLFGARGSLKAPEVFKTLMMLAAVAKPPRPEQKEALLAEYPKDRQDRPYLESLALLVPVGAAPPTELPWDRANRLYWGGDFDGAVDLLLACPLNAETLRLSFVCAHELNTLEAARVAMTVFGNVTPKDREVVLSSRLYRQILEELRQFVDPTTITGEAETIPCDWITWLEQVDRIDQWPAAFAVAQQGASEWEWTTYAHDAASVNRLAQLLIGGRSDAAQATLRLALPFIIGFFLPEGNPERFFKPIYLSCLELLALDDQLSSGADLEATSELALALLEIGLSETEYVDLIECFEVVWSRCSSPKHLDWAMDTLDLLITFPSPNQKVREAFFSIVLASVNRWARRLRPEQWEIFRLLCVDWGLGDAFNELMAGTQEDLETPPIADLLRENLAGRTIAVYTLMESVGRRLKTTLEHHYPRVKVSLSNDHVGNERLRTMAREADIFLVATKCATHAATQFIESHRPSSQPILFAPGKGSTGLLRVLYHHLASLQISVAA